MTAHTCHAPGCKRSCPSRLLMCHDCWRLVPKVIQDRVCATVTQRNSSIDASWAPWWRAQAQACAAVALAKGSNPAIVDRVLQRDLAFATKLEDMKGEHQDAP